MRPEDASTRGLSLVLVGIAALVLAGAAPQEAHPECPEAEPADAFSDRIDSLLIEVEGSGFPDYANLASWHERKGQIQLGFLRILGLTSSDDERRRTAVETLLAAESLAASPSQADDLSGSEPNEIRAWARSVLRGYTSLGLATPADERFVDGEIVASLYAVWDEGGPPHPERSLALYQDRASALRELARFRRSPSCEH